VSPLLGKAEITAVVQQRASDIGLDEIDRYHRKIMVTMRGDAEDLSFEVGNRALDERRTVRRLGPSHVSELVYAARSEDPSHLDLTGRQHVESHRVRAANL